MPDLDLTRATSPALIEPLAFTSVRKFPATVVIPRLRLGLSHVASSDSPACVGVTRQNSHWDQDIGGGGSIVHVHERNAQSLGVGHPGEVNGDHRRATPAKGGAPSARRYRHTGQRNGGGKGYHLLMRTRHCASAVFNPNGPTDRVPEAD